MNGLSHSAVNVIYCFCSKLTKIYPQYSNIQLRNKCQTIKTLKPSWFNNPEDNNSSKLSIPQLTAIIPARKTTPVFTTLYLFIVYKSCYSIQLVRHANMQIINSFLFSFRFGQQVASCMTLVNIFQYTPSRLLLHMSHCTWYAVLCRIVLHARQYTRYAIDKSLTQQRRQVGLTCRKSYLNSAWVKTPK